MSNDYRGVDGPDVAGLGSTVRRARGRLGLSVAQLAEISGVSMGLISQMERGQANPSLHTLSRLASGLGMPLSALLDSAEPGNGGLVPAEERIPLPDYPDQPPGVVRELLTPRSQQQLQLIRSELPPGFSNEDGPFRHLGLETIHLLEGSLLVTVGFRQYRLRPGDSLSYSCAQAHWWANDGDTVAVVLGAVIPIEP